MSPQIPREATASVLRRNLRRLWFGLLTLSGITRRGYFIPHRYAENLPAAGFTPAYEPVERLFAGMQDTFRQELSELEAYGDELLAIGSHPPPAPRWNQSWFPRLDGAAAYGLVRRHRPSRIIEVGSGHSTRFFAQAIKDGNIACQLTALDPAPRADIGKLPVTLHRMTLQEAGSVPFHDLSPNDFVIVDSSHILMPGSDVDFLLGRVLPLLPAGVILHVHDIFLPDDYPCQWGWRAYNEQQGILPLVLEGKWQTLFASHYVASRMADDVAASIVGKLARPKEAIESSLWLRKLG